MKPLLYIAIAFAALGCSFSERSDFGNIDHKGWAYGDTLSFDVRPHGIAAHDSDSAHIEQGDLTVVVRHNNNYPYSNIWLEIDYTGPDSLMTDTVNLLLADEFGNWLGKGLGMSFQHSQMILPDIRIDVSRPVKVTHIMRCDTLCDINQVGAVFNVRN